MKNNISYMKKGILILALAFAAVTFTSCKGSCPKYSIDWISLFR